MCGSYIEAAVRVMQFFADFCVGTGVRVVVILESGVRVSCGLCSSRFHLTELSWNWSYKPETRRCNGA